MRRYMRGVAAVELGILLMPLVLIAFGITEFGRAIYSYNTLAKSVRDGARFLTSKAPGDPANHTIARCMVVYGSTDCTGSSPPLAPGLTPGMVETCDAVLTCDGTENTLLTGTGTIRTVTVRISGYPYKSVVKFVMPDIEFNNISTTMRSHL